MAALQSMTLAERMNTINGDSKNAYTYTEAVNKRLKAMGTHNSVNYSGISLHKYKPCEALNIIYKIFHFSPNYKGKYQTRLERGYIC